MPRIPPPLIAIALALVAAALARMAPLASIAFTGHRGVALAFLASGPLLAFWAARTFRGAGTTVNPVRIESTSALVTSGPFAYSRNPMYLGLLLILVGVALWLGAASAFAAPPLFALYITLFQIRPEEDNLRVKFGDAFDDYCRQVRRWI